MKFLKKNLVLKILVVLLVLMSLILSLIMYNNSILNSRLKKLEKKYDEMVSIQKLRETDRRNKVKNNDLKELNLDNIDNLMIVAHPDDESIFGGAHLLENNNFLVVCITCGNDKNRVKEFEATMKEYNTKYLMLGYIDTDKSGVSDWGGKVRYNISRSLEEIISLKNWNKIVTHNPTGEYGNWHHIMTNEMVTDITETVFDNSILYYFGKYYSVEDANNLLAPTISNDMLNKKTEIIEKNYVSQKWACYKLKHIYRYENWIKAEDWKV